MAYDRYKTETARWREQAIQYCHEAAQIVTEAAVRAAVAADPVATLDRVVVSPRSGVCCADI